MLTQGWRAFFEVLRADYRGAGKITAYQVMEALWRPEVFLLLQAALGDRLHPVWEKYGHRNSDIL
ncbi:MAG TPA: hypothetical protein VF977_10550 [Candidatus Binatia bacterium]